MKKRILSALTVLVSLPAASFAQRATCDPNRSPLCKGLVSFYTFDESSDYLRRDSFSFFDLREPGGVNFGTGSDKVGGTASIWLNSSGALSYPQYGGIGSNFTVAVWVFLSNTTGQQFLLTTDGPSESGVSLYLQDGKPSIWTTADEVDTSNGYSTGSAISTSAWHLLVFTMSPYGPYGKAQACVSVDGGAFSCGSLSYNARPTANSTLTVGASYDNTVKYASYMDGLLIAGRVWSPVDVALYYNSGSGRNFPFY